MYKLVKYAGVVVGIVVCMTLALSTGDAAIGPEASGQTTEPTYPSTGAMPPVPSSAMLPGVEGGTTVPYPQMQMMPSTGSEGGYYYPPVVPGYQDAPGGMMSPYQPYPQYPTQPYPQYPNQPYPQYPNVPPGYADPSQPYPQYPSQGPPTYPDQYWQNPYQPNPWNPSMPGSGYYPPQYGSADQAYNQAMQAYRSRDYQTALSKFQEVATRYAQSDLADNAHYWTGEIYYAWKNFPMAIQSFQTVVQAYPQGNKVPDALLKMGYAYAEMRQYNIARSILTDVASRYSENARIRNLAVKKLNELNNIY